MKLDELYDQAVAKAKTDSSFRADLLANPKKALKDNFDFDFPDDVKVDFYQSTTEDYHFVLPKE